jgi:hypothetical protein
MAGLPIDPAELTEEDIKDVSTVFSFDIEQCKARLLRGDDWQRIIQGHLFFDHVMSAMISEQMMRPLDISIDRMNFPTKVELISAMGLIPTNNKPFLLGINKIRNKIAHNLGFKVTRTHANQLFIDSPKKFRLEIDRLRKDVDRSTLIFCTIYVNLLSLDIYRQRLVAVRLEYKKSSALLQKAIRDSNDWDIDKLKAKLPT